MNGHQLADRLYHEWKRSSGILSPFVDMLPVEWQTAERLDPELAAHLCETDFFGAALKHPLVFGVPYNAFDNPRYNYGLHWKKERLREYAADRDFEQFIYAHERPYRVDAIFTLIEDHNASAIEVWTCMRIAWMDSENIFKNEDSWRELFADWEGNHQEAFMGSEDSEEWAMLPDDQPVTVYRGFCVDGRDWGMSWTTDKVRAKFFAKRFAQQDVREPRLAIGRVMKHNCIGYLSGRNESEVVVLPENVDMVRVCTLKHEES